MWNPFRRFKATNNGEQDVISTPEFANEMRPPVLPCVETPLVTPEFDQFFTKDGKAFDRSALKDLQPVKGWVVKSRKIADGEGPSWTVDLAYEYANQIHVWRFTADYDGYHWAASAPEHKQWFEKTMVPGKPLTLLIDPKKLGTPIIFGQLELFYPFEGLLIWIADQDMKSKRIFKP